MIRTEQRWALLSEVGRVIATYADESWALSMVPKWGKSVVPCTVQYEGVRPKPRKAKRSRAK